MFQRVFGVILESLEQLSLLNLFNFCCHFKVCQLILDLTIYQGFLLPFVGLIKSYNILAFISWNLELDASDNFEKKERDLNRTFLHFLQSCNRLWKSALENSWRENNHKCLENHGIRDSWIKCLNRSDQSNFRIFELKVCLSPNFAQIKHFYFVQIPSKSKER